VTGIPEAGSRLGRYVVEESVGRGGMGAVYKIRDTRSSMPYAAKVLHPALRRRRDFVRRFKREAKIARRLRHMNVTHVFEMHRWRGTLFYVMEYVEGVALDELLDDRGALPLNESLAIIREIAAGLTYIHTRRYVHRDIKPGNILIRSDGHLKIADFGLAQRAGRTRRTRSGDIMGTAKYMAPELVRGGRVTARTDIYALGCLAYELIANRPPFEADNTEVYMDLHLYARPRSLIHAVPGTDRRLSLFIDKMLAKSSSRRVPTARMVHSWFDYCLTNGAFAEIPNSLRDL